MFLSVRPLGFIPCRPFETEFEDMLNLYPDGDAERQKELADSMKVRKEPSTVYTPSKMFEQPYQELHALLVVLKQLYY